MNRQPYQTPPRWWDSQLNDTFVRWWDVVRRRELKWQGILEIESSGADQIRQLLDQNSGVLIASNHSFHYDSYALIKAGLQANWTAHYMTAWQVFGLTGWFGKWLLQKHGCFSINRERTDTTAFRHAVSLLNETRHPLVIFPEGDIYHSNDRVMPFRDGLGAIALSATKRSTRPIHIVPCAMKAIYTSDPQPALSEMMERLEDYIRWRPQAELSLLERIYRFGNGFLALKEVEYLGVPQQGALPARIRQLAEAILDQVRTQHGIAHRGKDVTDQTKNLRTELINRIEEVLKTEKASPVKMSELTDDQKRQLDSFQQAMQDLFFVTQLSSYHGDYTSENPTVERIAETIDKFEEDVFELPYPTPRATRKVVVKFGEPIQVQPALGNSSQVTGLVEQAVQGLLDELNASRGSLD